MALVKPFCAIRPATDKVAQVASKSYDDYDKKERKATLAYNPYSFLHIINPGFKFHKTISGAERFTLVRNRYLEFLEEGIFIKDQKPSFYLYQISDETTSSIGLFCATSVQDYENNSIKKHENTLNKRVVLFKDYLKTVGFNAEPVLMTFKDNAEIDKVLTQCSKQTPSYDFSTTDKKRHTLWQINDDGTIQRLEALFKQQDALYIADGHHRSASSSLLTQELHENKKTSAGYFLSYLIPESNIRVYGYHRMISDLNGLSPEEFLIKLDAVFRIEEKGNVAYQPTEKHDFCMYLNGIFYALHLRIPLYTFTDELSHLDPQILYKTILNPILGITDLRNDRRISYVKGKNNILNLKESVDSGQFKVGFAMTPLRMEQIKAIADAHLVMPPKSTYIEPKLRSGLTIFEL